MQVRLLNHARLALVMLLLGAAARPGWGQCDPVIENTGAAGFDNQGCSPCTQVPFTGQSFIADSSTVCGVIFHFGGDGSGLPNEGFGPFGGGTLLLYRFADGPLAMPIASSPAAPGAGYQTFLFDEPAEVTCGEKYVIGLEGELGVRYGFALTDFSDSIYDCGGQVVRDSPPGQWTEGIRDYEFTILGDASTACGADCSTQGTDGCPCELELAALQGEVANLAQDQSDQHDALADRMTEIQLQLSTLFQQVSNIENTLVEADTRSCEIIRLLMTPEGRRRTTCCGRLRFPDGKNEPSRCGRPSPQPRQRRPDNP